MTEPTPDNVEPDFAEEHTKPTFADEPSTEDPDESVPEGEGGMDVGQRARPD
jgi:hypothetical protein